MPKTIKLIRKSVFETNSSSCHSLTISKINEVDEINKKLENLEKSKSSKSLYVKLEDMDGEFDNPLIFNTLEEKVAFLFMSILNTNKETEDLYKIDESNINIEELKKLKSGLIEMEIADDIDYGYLMLDEQRQIYSDFFETSGDVFTKVKLNQYGLEQLNKIKAILKKHYGIENIYVSQYFFGTCDWDGENFVFGKYKDLENYNKTKQKFDWVKAENIEFYSSQSDSKHVYPNYYTVEYFSSSVSYFNLPFYEDEEKLEQFLTNKSLIRIGSTISPIPYLKEDMEKWKDLKLTSYINVEDVIDEKWNLTSAIKKMKEKDNLEHIVIRYN